jgi:S-adenosylmethionine hydrolase
MILTLLTDFGAASPYVAILKGLALKNIPNLSLVDLSHQIHPGDIQEGQFFLQHCCVNFPKGSIHLAVVDPGVGTGRLPLAIQTDDAFFVGPDNGIFTFIQGKILAVHQISNIQIISPHPAPTFHGRDVFLPAALWLAKGQPITQLGPPLQPEQLVKKPLPEPVAAGETIQGQIVYVDSFGNLISNIPTQLLTDASSFSCRFLNWQTQTLTVTYASGSPTEPILTCSSFNLLEIALNGGSAAEWFQLDRQNLAAAPINVSIQQLPFPDKSESFNG